MSAPGQPRTRVIDWERRFPAALRMVTRRRRSPSLRFIGLALGPALLTITLAGPTPAEMTEQAQETAAVAIWMAVWWLSSALPMHVTALLPLLLLPTLGLRDLDSTTSAYRSGVIFLFLGGFVLALGVQKWNLHRRLAYLATPSRPRSASTVLLSFMAVTAFLSAWMSNTAAAMAMLPAAAEVVRRSEEVDDGGERLRGRMGPVFMLGVAYAASVGGIATIIGSPPNAILAGFSGTVLGESVGFIEWMSWGVPMAAVSVLIVWLALTRLAFRHVAGITITRGDQISVEKLGTPQWRVLLIFGAVVALWLARGLTPLAESRLTDEDIAMAGAMLLFVLPDRGVSGPRLLRLPDLRSLPWSILVLFGGGIALADAIESSGLATWIARQLIELQDLPVPVILIAFILVTIMFTELASNTATAAVLIAVAHGAAVAMGLMPIQLMLAVTVAASCAFMLPVATPPNAVVFASGQVMLGQMIRTGLLLNLVMTLVIALTVGAWVPLVRPDI